MLLNTSGGALYAWAKFSEGPREKGAEPRPERTGPAKVGQAAPQGPPKRVGQRVGRSDCWPAQNLLSARLALRKPLEALGGPRRLRERHPHRGSFWQSVAVVTPPNFVLSSLPA